MNINTILKPEIQKFITENLQNPISEVALKLSKAKKLPAKEILHQLKGRQKAKNKIPSWFEIPEIIFPEGISIEQCSSEITAKYKSSLVSGNKLIDLSAGFGVDAAFFSKVFNEVLLVEPNSELIEIAAHNFSLLNIKNTSFYNKQAEDFIENYKEQVDCIYIDPSRRSSDNRKQINLKDCAPDIVQLQTSLFKVSPRILIKTSPLLDIHIALTQLKNTKKIIILAYQNECKEVLYLLERNFSGLPLIEAVNIKANTRDIFSFTIPEEENADVDYALPLTYLYEPNAAILKGGAFKIIAQRYNLKKLHANSHLYTSEEKIENFPGRYFNVKAVSKYNKKDILALLSEKKANITVRNFKESVKEIYKKINIQEGGTEYIFATTGPDNKPIIIICTPF